MSTTGQYPDFTGLTFETVRAMFKESDKRLERLEKTVAKTSREIGNLGNRFGEVIERMVAGGVIPQFNALGFHFTRKTMHEYVLDPLTGATLTEMDIVLENGEAVIVVEIKVKPNFSDINKHIRRLKIYRESRQQSLPNDTKKIYGAIASPVLSDEIRDAALQAGFYTMEQSGKAMVINVPEGFVPTAF